MNYKETLFFIAKSLTISLEEINRKEIELILKTKNVDWEAVVKVSTAHYVLPALYCNFKRTDFLKYLPTDLVNYMLYITNINRERNTKIIHQVLKLNSILLKNNIRPIFIKGSGNLLANIYKDIAERMVGDIDLIFSKEDYPKAINVVKGCGYFEIKKREYYDPGERHYSKLKINTEIAVLEIHSRFLDIKKYDYEFDYNFVTKDTQVINGVKVLSFANKLNLSIIAYQINDNGFYFKRLALRNAYDVFLLSRTTNTLDAISSLNKLSHPLNCFLAVCHEVFNRAETITYNKNEKTSLYLKNFNDQFKKPVKEQSKITKICMFIKRIIYILYKSIIHKDYRSFLIKALTDKNWYYQKLIQFGIKNSKTNK
tara:strand:- start:2169 stop:3278 length:1110 start_codon:yes stop_codon:yes gene_type:complete